MRESKRWSRIAMLLWLPALMVAGTALSQSPDESLPAYEPDAETTIRILTAEIDTLSTAVIVLKAERDSLDVELASQIRVSRANEDYYGWLVQKYKDRSGGILSDPRVWFLFGALLMGLTFRFTATL